MTCAAVNIYKAGGAAKRRENDFYPTRQSEFIHVLIDAEGQKIPPGTITDPACGEGDILKVFADRGYRTNGSDLIDRGYGRGGIDFLTVEMPEVDIIVTNPPYDNALDEAFVLRAIDMRVKYAAFLLKSEFFHCQRRLRLYDRCAPARIYPLTSRPDFTGQGRNHKTFSWVVFTPRRPTHPNETRTMRPLLVPR